MERIEQDSIWEREAGEVNGLKHAQMIVREAGEVNGLKYAQMIVPIRIGASADFWHSYPLQEVPRNRHDNQYTDTQDTNLSISMTWKNYKNIATQKST